MSFRPGEKEPLTLCNPLHSLSPLQNHRSETYKVLSGQTDTSAVLQFSSATDCLVQRESTDHRGKEAEGLRGQRERERGDGASLQTAGSEAMRTCLGTM